MATHFSLFDRERIGTYQKTTLEAKVRIQQCFEFLFESAVPTPC